MKRSIVFLSALLAAQILVGAAPETSPPDSVVAVEPDTTWRFRLEVGSRLYPDWKEEHTTRFEEDFYLGDTELVARVVRFVPDFRLKDGEVVNWSNELANPAAFIYVVADTGAVDSVWAFLNFPPHYSARSFFSFKLLDVTGYGGSVVPGDGGDN